MKGIAMPSVEKNRIAEDFRVAMRHWASGVAVVTGSAGGLRSGMTVSSFTSVSLEPPLVLVSMEKNTRTHHLVTDSGYFGVTVLREDQQAVSDCFAGRECEGEDRFDKRKTMQFVSGSPLLQDGLAWFDCQVANAYSGGTHTLFIGQVLAVQSQSEGQPLVYHNRRYRGVHSIEE
jgi:flavin reductase (DIM6/NTAB) family NADH-FMN oxidoreductase RutF